MSKRTKSSCKSNKLCMCCRRCQSGMHLTHFTTFQLFRSTALVDCFHVNCIQFVARFCAGISLEMHAKHKVVKRINKARCRLLIECLIFESMSYKVTLIQNELRFVSSNISHWCEMSALLEMRNGLN